jgi:hypothetical protein
MTEALTISFNNPKDLGAVQDPVQMTDAEEPQIAASGNNVYVLWREPPVENAKSDVFFKRSTDGGKTFEKTKNLSNNPEDSLAPQIAASGNNVYVVWQDDTPGNAEILFRRSTDKGDNFDSQKNLSNNLGTSTVPQIAASKNNVYVVWQDDTPGNAEIFFRESNNKGDNFDSQKNLSNNPEDSFDPQLRTSGNKVYVVWRDFSTAGAGFNTYFIRSK